MKKKKELREGEGIEAKVKNKSKNKELYLILGVIAFSIVIFFASYFIFGSLNKFKYEGLTFTKEKFGDIPVFHHYYYFNANGQLYKYNLFLRNDPRKNNVPITGKAVDIEFSKYDTIYISLDPNNSLEGCKYAAVGISNLASFLTDNQLYAKGASTDEEQAKLNNVEHVTCDNVGTFDIGIILKSGDETRVIHGGRNCYVIEISNCEVLEAIEKFEVESVLDARERALREEV